MILTLACLIGKVIKTNCGIVDGGGPPPEGLEDVIPENRWVHMMNVPGRREEAAFPLPTPSRRSRIGQMPMDSVPRRFYMQIWNKDDTTFLIVPRTFQGPQRDWIRVRFPRCVSLTTSPWCWT